jgi:DNA-binding NarL/FixJ family response regulator
MKKRIILADDHNILRQGLKAIIEQNFDYEIVAECANGKDAIKLAEELVPDLMILDISMPEINGIDAAKQILNKNPKIKIIALSMYSEKYFVVKMLKAGALGYILKDCVSNELFDAINTVLNNRFYLSREITSVLSNELTNSNLLHKDNIDIALSDKERDIIKQIAEGKSTKEIAYYMNISTKTIETHRKNIMDKLNLHSIPELTKFAIKTGIISLD